MTIHANSPTTGSTSCTLDTDTTARIALACAGLNGDPTIAVAIDTFGGAAPFVAAVHDGRDAATALSPMTRQRVRALATASRVAAVLEAMAMHGINVLGPLHQEWPNQLGSLLRAAPLVLFTRGDVTTLKLPAIALTGTAAPGVVGIHMALELGTGLAGRGWVIAAGSGRGIDDFALQAARAMGGATITVFGSSPEGDLGQLHYGEVQVSELPPSAVVTTRSQLRARHLLAAITTKTVLIQAGLASRAVRTAEAAHALGRPVGVVLGAEGNPTGAGCHDFATRHGALVIGNIQDADLLR